MKRAPAGFATAPIDDADEVPLTRVLAIRHGETAWNVETRMQGQLDVPLNATGRRQAERLAHALADAGITALYASDLQRARATAEAVARVSGLALSLDAGLRERCFGVFEGMTFHEVEQRWPEQSRRWRQRDPDFAPPGAESLRQFDARCVGAAARLAAAHPGQTIAVVAHGGVLDCLYRAATRVGLQAPRSWQLGNASINRLLFTAQGFSLVGWSDTQHLDGIALDEADGSDGEAALDVGSAA